MAQVECSFSERVGPVTCEALRGHERLGEAAEFELEILSAEPIDAAQVLRKSCAVLIMAGPASRTICGIVTRIASAAARLVDGPRRHSLTVRSGLALLAHKRRSRIFQHQTAPDIVRQVLVEGGYDARAVRLALHEPHAPRAYVVQYAEDDATFVRRLCEEEGLYFRFDVGDGEEVVLEDTSSSAPPALGTPLPVVDESMLASRLVVAFGCRAARQRRPGKVTVRGYDPEHPAVALEAAALAGSAFERGTEVYVAPASAALRDACDRDAALVLESLRAEASSVHFRTRALMLAPGLSVELASEDGLASTARPNGKFLVVGLSHRWRRTAPEYELEAHAIPLTVPYRLPRITPRPRIAGLHSAVVTGAPGEEVHVDDQGRVCIRFLWDREGPGDDRSSLPVRVMQPNMPGSMLLPRVGWEVLVLFEGGDPDRPVVVGRTYNAKQPPPCALPTNKTMTCLATSSSPGAAKQNSITFDDGAGRQHLAISAGNDKTLAVGANMVAQTANNEKHGVEGSQSWSVGADEHVSVGQAYAVSAASQSGSVGGSQDIYVKGNFSVGVASEAVAIGAALLEQVGNPASGAANLATSAALTGAAALGSAGGLFAAGAGFAKGGLDGAQQGGAQGAAAAAGQGLLQMAAGMVPGGEAILSSVQGMGIPAPWDEAKEAPGSQEAGGGAGGGASDASGPAGPGPGHRNTVVKGAMTEAIAGLYSVTTPGPIMWMTTGPSTIFVGGSHSTATAKASVVTAGASSETLGCLNIRSKGHLERLVQGLLNTSIAGSLTSSAEGMHAIKAGGAITVRIGGGLTLSGAHVTFECGGTKLSASPGGVLIEANTITVTNSSSQTASTTHT